jgi:hypothetical protein
LKEIIFDYSLLKEEIAEKYGSNEKMNKNTNITNTTFSGKINNKVEFKQSEMIQIIKALDGDMSDIPKYFFNISVKKT